MTERLLTDMARFNPITSVRQAVWRVRDYFHFQPMAGFRAREVTRGAFSSLAVAETLKSRGICVLENYLSAEALKAYQAAWNDLELSPPYPDSPDMEPNSLIARIDFVKHPIFADLVLDDLVLAGIEAYYGRPISLVVPQAWRLDPIEPYEGTAFRWHHDCKGKYVKAMWLITDVPPNGQRMSYIAGSHSIKHRWTSYEETRFTDEQVKDCGERVECAAPAGSVVIFDTNGFHRGNRNLGPTRDTIYGTYSAGRYRLGCEFDLATLPHLSEWQKAVLLRSRTPS